jgi:hypothetical protein
VRALWLLAPRQEAEDVVTWILVLGGSRYASKWAHWLVVKQTVAEMVEHAGSAPVEVWDGGQTGIDSWGTYLARDYRAKHLAFRARGPDAASLSARTRFMVESARRDGRDFRVAVFPMFGQKNPGSNLLYGLVSDLVGAEEHRLVRRFVET